MCVVKSWQVNNFKDPSVLQSCLSSGSPLPPQLVIVVVVEEEKEEHQQQQYHSFTKLNSVENNCLTFKSLMIG
jgi:hypothetical protein